MSTTIFEAIRKDHEVQRDLISKLVNTSGDTEARSQTFDQLKEELSNHALAEERFFYNPLTMKDLTAQHARHSVAEHHELDELIETLESTEYSSPAWLVKAKQLEEKLIHHLDEEEKEIFPVAGKALAEKQKTKLATEYAQEMEPLREAR